MQCFFMPTMKIDQTAQKHEIELSFVGHTFQKVHFLMLLLMRLLTNSC